MKEKNKRTVWDWFNRLVQSVKQMLGIIPKDVAYYTEESIKVINNIKKAIDSGTALTLVSIFPGETDDNIRAWISDNLTKAALAMEIVNDCKDSENIEDVLACLERWLKPLSKHMRDATYHKLNSVLVSFVHGEQLRQRLYDLYTDIKYIDQK